MSEQKNILPPDAIGAVNYMIRLIDQLIAVMDREAMAMTTRDTIAFAAAQDEKQRLTEIYTQASAEFGARLQEFRGVDAKIVDRLVARQEQLKSKTLDNSAALERISV